MNVESMRCNVFLFILSVCLPHTGHVPPTALTLPSAPSSIICTTPTTRPSASIDTPATKRVGETSDSTPTTTS